MAPKKKDLDAQLRRLTAEHHELADKLRQLATHTAVLGVALRQPDAVPPADLDAAFAGITQLAARQPPNQ